MYSFSKGVALYPRLWLKCSSGTLRIQNTLNTGTWNIDCAAASGGAWTFINSGSQTGVTEAAPWVSRASDGAARWFFWTGGGSVAAYVWAPTVTEDRGSNLSVIPTAASVVSTGSPSWAIDNSSGNYYQAGDTVTQTLTEISGTCWVVDATQLRMTGATGSPCAGVWYALQVEP